MENNKPKKRSRIGLYAMWMSLGVVVAGATGYAIAAAINNGTSDPEATKEHAIEIDTQQTTGFSVASSVNQAKVGDKVIFTVTKNGNSVEIPSSIRITSTKDTSLFAEYPLKSTGTGSYEAEVTITFASAMKVELRLENYFVVTFDQNEPSTQTTTKTTVNVKNDEKVSKPLDPAIKGYTFKGWSQTVGGTLFDFDNTPITSDITLYANWEAIPKVTKITLPTSLDIDVDDTVDKTISADVTCGTGADKTLIWKSSDESVVKVTPSTDTLSATVKKVATSVTSCVITVTSAAFPDVSASCKVNVTNELLQYQIVSEEDKTCSVGINTAKLSKASGYLEIPSSIIIGENTYKVVSITGLANTNFTSISIPSTITDIATDAFKGCYKLESINVASDNAKFYSIDGILYSIDSSSDVTLVCVPSNKAFGTTTFNVPSTVTYIESYAFCNVQNITYVNIPTSVNQLNTNWLYVESSGPTGLANLTFDNSDGVWTANSASDAQLIIDKEDASVTFSNFKEKATALLGETDFNTVGFLCADYDDTNMTCKVYSNNSTIPSSGEVVVPEYIVKKVSGKLKNYRITDMYTNGNDWGFYNCSRLLKITLPKSITTIQSYAFQRCTQLTDVVLPSTITKIDDRAFEYCYALKNINLNNSIERIGDYAFDRCYVLPLTSLPTALQYIGTGAFQYCYALAITSLPTSLQYMGGGAFYYCMKAFENETGILTLPTSLTYIGDYVFSYCTNIKSFSIGNNYFWTSNGCLMDYYGNHLISVPAGKTDAEEELDLSSLSNVINIHKGAFAGCSCKNCILPPYLKTVVPYSFVSFTVESFSISTSSNYFKTDSDGCLYSKDGLVLYAIPDYEGKATYTVPSTLAEIAPSVGYGSYYLENVDFSYATALEIINFYAFAYCWKITNVDMSGATSLKYMTNNVFTQCDGKHLIEEVKIPSSMIECRGFNSNYTAPAEEVFYIAKVFCDSPTLASSNNNIILFYNTKKLFVKTGLNVGTSITDYFTKESISTQTGYDEWTHIAK